MEQIMPIEELAKQRLNALVFTVTLFIKHLMEEGVELGTVKKAIDRVWGVLGAQAAAQMKPFFSEPIDIQSIKMAAMMAETVHGIVVNHESSQSELKSEFTSCPWQDCYIALNMPNDWRLCPSSHVEFAKNMFQGLSPKANFELSQNMPNGAKTCKAKTVI
jgi:hypothetical protein